MVELDEAVSFLFVPGDRSERFAKALASGADAVILDLEDAVAPGAKSAARSSVAAFLAEKPAVIVRTNAPGTPWFSHDIAMLSVSKPAALMLPKAEGGEVLAEIALQLGGCGMVALIETAAGMASLERMASVPGVSRFAFGSIDFQLDMGIDEQDEELLPYRSELVLRSRVAGLAPPIDGISTAIDDAHELDRQSRRARRMGFGGKLCIHPCQVDTVRNAFLPSSEEIHRAERIVAAADAAGAGVVTVDGRMVDLPVVLLARKTLQIATKRTANRNTGMSNAH